MRRRAPAVPAFVSRTRAQRLVLQTMRPLGGERCAVQNACGRAFARDVRSPIDLPPFRRSLMDGYAIAEGARGGTFEIKGDIRAGEIASGRLRHGQAVRVMTGAMLPMDAGRVAMKEHVEIEGDHCLRITKEDAQRHIAERGAFVRRGALLARSGELVTPALAATLAMAGIDRVWVARRPRVGVLTTGDEFAAGDRRLVPGKVYECNGALLRGLLTSWGVGSIEERRAGDALPQLVRELRRLLAQCDVVITVGGISVGEHDLVAKALAACGACLRLRKVAIQPGKPFALATRGRVPIFALPGNPASVFVTAHLFVRPALARMAWRHEEMVPVARRLREAFAREDAGRELFLPVRMRGARDCEAVPYGGSGDLPAMARAEGLMIVPAGVRALRSGSTVQVLVLPRP